LEANRERFNFARWVRCVAVAVAVAVAVVVVVGVVVAVAVGVAVAVVVAVVVGVAVVVVKKSADPRERAGAFALIRPLRRRRFGWRYGLYHLHGV
jgi:uncharacterized membrane protein